MTTPERTPLSLRPTAPCRRCTTDLLPAETADGYRCCDCTEAELQRILAAGKAWEDHNHRAVAPTPTTSDRAGRAVVWLLLIALCGVFWAAVLVGAQAAACAAWDSRLAYCPGYEAQP